MEWELPDVTQSYTIRDSILYAIGVGASIDPIDDGERRLLYEGTGLITLPTMATVVGQRSMWMDDPALGITWQKVVHGEQMLTVHLPLPPQGSIVSSEKVTGVYDKGRDKGAIVQLERTIRDAGDGSLYATLTTSYFLRGDGGFGGSNSPATAKPAVPEGSPDMVVDLPTRSDQAMIYRLSGDTNPLHIDRDFARNVGYPAPILHGLCTYGIAARAIIRAVCGCNPGLLSSINARFSAHTFPGETIRTELWRLPDRQIAFRARAVERDIVVLSNGSAKIRS